MEDALPAITPTRISISATEIPILIETMLANNASAIHTLATSHTFESTASLLEEKKKTPTRTRTGEGRSH